MQLRIAAILMWFIAATFGLPTIQVIKRLLDGKGLPMIFGIRAYGGGPFEQLEVSSVVTLLAGFFFVCVLDAIAAWLLWKGEHAGAILALALLPVEAVFWYGFSLPIPPMFALARTALVVWGLRGV